MSLSNLPSESLTAGWNAAFPAFPGNVTCQLCFHLLKQVIDWFKLRSHFTVQTEPLLQRICTSAHKDLHMHTVIMLSALFPAEQRKPAEKRRASRHVWLFSPSIFISFSLSINSLPCCLPFLAFPLLRHIEIGAFPRTKDDNPACGARSSLGNFI